MKHLERIVEDYKVLTKIEIKKLNRITRNQYKSIEKLAM